MRATLSRLRRSLSMQFTGLVAGGDADANGDKGGENGGDLANKKPVHRKMTARRFRAAHYDVDNSGSVGWWEFVTCWKDNAFFIKLSTAERIFLTVDDASSCILAKVISFIVMSVILVSSVCFMIATLPSLQSPPDPNSEKCIAARESWMRAHGMADRIDQAGGPGSARVQYDPSNRTPGMVAHEGIDFREGVMFGPSARRRKRRTDCAEFRRFSASRCSRKSSASWRCGA